MAEFQWWLLLVGLVAGGGLVAVLYMDGARNEQDISDDELPAEAAWIAERLRAGGRTVDPMTVERVLIEHRAYRTEPPPDRVSPANAEPPNGDVAELLPTRSGPGSSAGAADSSGD
ncbi:MAG: hypothetical protein ABI598_03055 [Chloroflexota bacterium]